MSSELHLSCLIHEQIPSSDDKMIPCFITKFINQNEIFIQFAKYKDSFAEFMAKMVNYYDNKLNKIYINRTNTKQRKNNLFIYCHRKTNVYYRVKLIDLFTAQKYLVLILDCGFELIVDESDLFLNDNPEFLKLPVQGFRVSLKFDYEDDKLFKNSSNKGKIISEVEALVIEKEKFFVEIIDNNFDLIDGKIYCSDNGNSISLTEFIMNKIRSESNDVCENNEKMSEIDGDEVPKSISSSTPSFQSSIVANPLLQEPTPIQMKLKEIVSPKDFFVNFIPDSDYKEFKMKLKSFANSDKISMKNDCDKPIIGKMYGAIGEHHRNPHLRVLVQSYDRALNEYQCFEIDKGMIYSYTSSKLFELPDELAKFPARSVRASLHGIKPKNDDEKFSFELQMKIQELVDFEKVEIIVIDFDSEKYHIDCIMIAKNVHVNDYLIENDLAEFSS